jgi:hypothetical protein
MRIVMQFNVGDGYTFCCTETFPIEYESQEAALVDFEELVKQSAVEKVAAFKFAGHEFYYSSFYSEGRLELPEFLTIDEWFAQQ